MSIHWYNLRTNPLWCAVCPGETLCGRFSISIKSLQVSRQMFDRVRHKGLTSHCCTLLSPCLQSPTFIHSFAAHTQAEHDFLPPSLSLLSRSLYKCLCLLVDSLTADIMKGNHCHAARTSFLRHYFPPNLTFVGFWHHNCSWATVARAAVARQPTLPPRPEVHIHLHAVMKRSVPMTRANEKYKQRNDNRLLNLLYPPKKRNQGRIIRCQRHFLYKSSSIRTHTVKFL